MASPGARHRLRVFLSHASGDNPAVRDLYGKLISQGVDPWLDEKKILPGQDWQLEIARAVRETDVVIICLSSKSVTKEGFVQKEIRMALDIASEKPEGTVFLIPARLDECYVPERLRVWQWVDLFSAGGYDKLLESLSLRAESLGVTGPLWSSLPPMAAAREKVLVLLDGDFQAFTKIEEKKIIETLSGVLNISIAQIRVLQVGEGSILLTIELPEEAARRLLNMYLRQDQSLAALKIQRVELAFDEASSQGRLTTKSQSSKTNTRRARSTSHPMIKSRPNRVDVLLLTTTEVEREIVLSVAEELLKREPKPFFVNNLSCFYLGKIKGAEIAMTFCNMGSGGKGGSTLTVNEAILSLSPFSIIMVGLAFGVNKKKQRIGDILISQRLWLYELQKVGTTENGLLEIIPRGDRPSASVRLLGRFESGATAWNKREEYSAKSGLILSGDKLVDHQDFRDQLLKLETEAIGGEMEGAGLYAAADRHKIDWILVKAICDWADGKKYFKKKFRQELAAYNAVRFLFSVLSRGGFGRETLIEQDVPLNTRPDEKSQRNPARDELVASLLECSSMRNRSGRDRVVDELPKDIRDSIERQDAPKKDMAAIVSRCMEFPDGLETLLQRVQFYEGDSIAMARVCSLIR